MYASNNILVCDSNEHWTDEQENDTAWQEQIRKLVLKSCPKPLVSGPASEFLNMYKWYL